MIGVRRRRRQRSSSVTDWLDLLTTEGPFLAGPVAKEVWPNGLPALEHEAVQRLREASARLEASPGTRDSFVREVLGEFLGWGDRLLTATELPPGLVTPVPEHATEVRPDFALAGREGITPALLGLVTPPGTRAGARVVARGASTWTASPSDRLAHALRVQGVPLGLVTDGGEWTLVCLTRGAVSSATWTRHIWLDDVETLKTFHALLCRQRFFGVEDERTLPALLDQSIDRQEEITQRLKEQAQAVVDMLVATVGQLDAEANLRRGVSILGDDVEPSDVYAACVTVLMRTLFLLYAEELSLLPIDDPEYSGAYAASTLASELRERANERGEDALERSSVAWQRLLATSRALHRGARHPDLLLPAYGGGLFDPDRFPWLEGRSARDPLGSSQPLAIDDRTMLHSLEALQTLQFGRERRRISFRQLDVEQIGYVYEGLIGQDATRSDEWVLGVAGDSAGERDGPELALSTLELKLEDGPDAFAAWLAPLTKTSAGGRSERASSRICARRRMTAVGARYLKLVEATSLRPGRSCPLEDCSVVILVTCRSSIRLGASTSLTAPSKRTPAPCTRRARLPNRSSRAPWLRWYTHRGLWTRRTAWRGASSRRLRFSLSGWSTSPPAAALSWSGPRATSRPGWWRHGSCTMELSLGTRSRRSR